MSNPSCLTLSMLAPAAIAIRAEFVMAWTTSKIFSVDAVSSQCSSRRHDLRASFIRRSRRSRIFVVVWAYRSSIATLIGLRMLLFLLLIGILYSVRLKREPKIYFICPRTESRTRTPVTARDFLQNTYFHKPSQISEICSAGLCLDHCLHFRSRPSSLYTFNQISLKAWLGVVVSRRI